MGKYFTLEELIKSDTAVCKSIKNIPSKLEELNLLDLIDNILDPLREAYGKPIIITSGFRSNELNSIIGGSINSLHCAGQAVDITSSVNTILENKKLFELVQKLKLPYDLLLDEHNYDWVHVSYSPKNRRQVLHIK